MFPYSFTPQDWGACDGQLMPISQNQALFSLIGTVYGGDGMNTMALPNMKGRAPMHSGQGPGLSNREIGQMGGTDGVILQESQLPEHSHDMAAHFFFGQTDNPAGENWSGYQTPGQDFVYTKADSEGNPPILDVAMSSEMIEPYGTSGAHENMQPYLGVPFFIALDGIYPSRS